MTDFSERGSAISLLIAEHSRMGCELMEMALQSYRHISVTASVVESSELLDIFEGTRPDVCVISSALKDGPSSGLRVARELHDNGHRAKLIMLLDSSDRNLVVEAFRSGADGIFSRDDSFELLARCVQRVYEGQVWANSQQLQFAIEALANTSPSSIVDAKGVHLLTKRELSVVTLVAEGRSNRDISQELRLSEHTVRNYLFRIFNKLGVSTRLELAIYAINNQRVVADLHSPTEAH
ncbi:MAG TPA: response regulator transcription factor [Candidatus Acidoferrum sp.]|jgi:DNA-binding NarL/FixJ family response regulator